MLNQILTAKKEASEPPEAIAVAPVIHPHRFSPSAGLVARADAISRKTKSPKTTLLAAEYTVAHLVTLPKASARQQAPMMRFAVEEHIGTSLESVVVSRGPTHGAGGHLALVTSNAVLDAQAETEGLFPELLMVPPPTQAASWAVWRDGDRAVVRASDSTGFAVPMDMFGVAWQSAGRPAVYSLADPLPADIAATDQSANPPAPLTADMTFRFANDHKRENASVMRTLIFAGSAILVAGLAHLAIFAVETWALGKQAERARVDAQSAIATILPNVTLTGDNTAILTRLAPRTVAAKSGAFLPLLTDVSRVISATPTSDATPVTFRRLAWGAQTDQLVLLVQTGGLEAMQAVQQNLEANGFTVTTGAATAGDGGAEAEMRITREGGQ